MRHHLSTKAAATTLAVSLTMLAGGCASDECEDNKNSLPLAVIMASLPEPQEAELDSISVYGIGAPGDSLLLDSASSVGQMYLPFRIDETRTTYVIRYLQSVIAEKGICDTISFNYDIKPMFVSSACGAVYYYDNIRIENTTHFIDSVTCPGNRITNANIPNIFIYFRINED